MNIPPRRVRYMPTMFSRIISGEIDSYKLYEDKYTFAFLDIFPFQPGHTLIIPKIEIDYFVDVPEPYYTGVFLTAKQLAPAIQQAVGAERVGTMIQGMDVPHFHYHIIPMYKGEPFLGKKKSFSRDEMLDIQAKIIQYL